MISLSGYIKEKIKEGATTINTNLSLMSNGEIMADENGMHNIKFDIEVIKK